jgi:hypothetical protein
VVPDLPPLPLPRGGPPTQHVVANQADYDAIYCVSPLSRDPARRREKGRFAAFGAVVHFEKPVNKQKIGSPRDDRPVI